MCLQRLPKKHQLQFKRGWLWFLLPCIVSNYQIVAMYNSESTAAYRCTLFGFMMNEDNSIARWYYIRFNGWRKIWRDPCLRHGKQVEFVSAMIEWISADLLTAERTLRQPRLIDPSLLPWAVGPGFGWTPPMRSNVTTTKHDEQRRRGM